MEASGSGVFASVLTWLTRYALPAIINELSGGKSCVNQVAENESEDTADLVVSYGSFESSFSNVAGLVSDEDESYEEQPRLQAYMEADHGGEERTGDYDPFGAAGTEDLNALVGEEGEDGDRGERIFGRKGRWVCHNKCLSWMDPVR